MDWTLLVSLGSPVAAVIAAWLTAKATGKNEVRHAAVAERKQSSDNWDNYTKVLQADNADLRGRILHINQEVTDQIARYRTQQQEELYEAQEAYDKQISYMQAEYEDRMRKIETRVSDAEIQQKAAEIRAVKSDRKFSIAIAYLRDLLSWARIGVYTIPMPSVPYDLQDDL